MIETTSSIFSSITSIFSRFLVSDEYSLLSSVGELLWSLADQRIVALIIVVFYYWMWRKMEAMSLARADAERRRCEQLWGCADRPSLKEIVLKEHGVLFGPTRLLDVIRNIQSDGRHPVNQAGICDMTAPGCIWQSRTISVTYEPVNKTLHDQVCDRVNKDLGDALIVARVGSIVTFKQDYRVLSGKHCVVDLDDPPCFVSFYEDQKLWKRVEVVSLDEISRAKFDFDYKTIQVPSKSGALVVLKDFNDDMFLSLALVVAHSEARASEAKSQNTGKSEIEKEGD